MKGEPGEAVFGPPGLPGAQGPEGREVRHMPPHKFLSLCYHGNFLPPRGEEDLLECLVCQERRDHG